MSGLPRAKAHTDYFVETTDRVSGRPLQMRYAAGRLELTVMDPNGGNDVRFAVALADLRFAIRELAAPAWRHLADKEEEDPQ